MSSETDPNEGEKLTVRKEQTFPNLPEPTSSKYMYEDDQARSRDFGKDCEIISKIIQDSQKFLDDTWRLKQNEKVETKEGEFEKFKSQGRVAMARMKKFNRLQHIRIQQCKNDEESRNEERGGTRFQLLNRNYELSQIKDEIENNRKFSPLHEELSLADDDESNMDVETTDEPNEHKRMLARLACELELRKKLQVDVKGKNLEKEGKVKLFQTQKKNFSDLMHSVMKVDSASEQQQRLVGVNVSNMLKMDDATKLLPVPLLSLYLGVKAFIKAQKDDSISISIEGNHEEGQKAHENMLSYQWDNSKSSDEDSTDDEEKTAAKKIPLEMKQAALQKPFPLYIEMKLESAIMASFKLSFYHFPKLNIITGQCKFEQSVSSAGNFLKTSTLLDGMFEGNVGDVILNAASAYQTVNLCKHVVKDFGKPYMWVQRLCGATESRIMIMIRQLQEIFADEHEQSSTGFLSRFVTTLKQHLANRLSLDCQAANLEKGIVEVAPNVQHLFPNKAMSSLHSWKYLSCEEFNCLAYTKEIQQQGFYCKVVVKRLQGSSSMNVAIFIPLSSDLPKFFLGVENAGVITTSKEDDNLKSMEDELNVPNVNFKCEEVLTKQVQHLLMRCDAYFHESDDKKA